MSHFPPEPTEFIRRRIDEYVAMKGRAQDLADAVLETALYVEEVFGIVIPDTEITAENLGTAEAINQYLSRRLRSE